MLLVIKQRRVWFIHNYDVDKFRCALVRDMGFFSVLTLSLPLYCQPFNALKCFLDEPAVIDNILSQSSPKHSLKHTHAH